MLYHLRRLGLLATLVTLAFSSLLANPATGQLTKTCGARTVSQPFAPWLDLSHYFLLTGGDLEAASGWTLAGGARLVAGNEPFLVHGGGDTQSLLLPSGSSAGTAAACFDTDEPTLRFFVRNTGSPLSTLAVEAHVSTTVLGVTTQTTLPLGVVPGTTQSWQPSLPLVFELSLNQLAGGTASVVFGFTPLGAGGNWQIDDVYVDPIKER
jgi:hypothetical protein